MRSVQNLITHCSNRREISRCYRKRFLAFLCINACSLTLRCSSNLVTNSEASIRLRTRHFCGSYRMTSCLRETFLTLSFQIPKTWVAPWLSCEASFSEFSRNTDGMWFTLFILLLKAYLTCFWGEIQRLASHLTTTILLPLVISLHWASTQQCLASMTVTSLPYLHLREDILKNRKRENNKAKQKKMKMERRAATWEWGGTEWAFWIRDTPKHIDTHIISFENAMKPTTYWLLLTAWGTYTPVLLDSAGLPSSPCQWSNIVDFSIISVLIIFMYNFCCFFFVAESMMTSLHLTLNLELENWKNKIKSKLGRWDTDHQFSVFPQ